MARYELFSMTGSGAIVGTFDDIDEANELFKWARTQKEWSIVTRKIEDDVVVKEKRFNIDRAYNDGLEPSIDGLKDAVNHVSAEIYPGGNCSLRRLFFAYPHEEQPIIYNGLTMRQVENIMAESVTERGYGTEWVWIPSV